MAQDPTNEKLPETLETPMSNKKPLSWYQDKRFLWGAFAFIVIVWIAIALF